MKLTSVALAALFSCVCYPALAIGAIAIDDVVGEDEPGFGYSTGYNDQASAEKRALQECRKHGNGNCKVMVWYATCGAYAASSKYYGIGWGVTRQIAEKQALDQCARRSCQIKVSQCERQPQ